VLMLMALCDSGFQEIGDNKEDDDDVASFFWRASVRASNHSCCLLPSRARAVPCKRRATPHTDGCILIFPLLVSFLSYRY
jgi:hypothetical protein